jgi:CheY-like chemotaxis protein
VAESASGLAQVRDDAGTPRLLLVDDDVVVRTAMELVLGRRGFDVVAAANVNEALKLIGERTFDVLLSDLHMPQPGDGLTVVSAMRHANPKAVTLIFSAYPEMNQATAAILMQADDILVKPMAGDSLAKIIRERLVKGAGPERPAIESVAAILERETQSTIQGWLDCVDVDPLVNIVPLHEDQRCAHLPQLFRDLILRLRNPPPLGGRAPISQPAVEHGLRRREQGYSAAMLVEESRMLQVSIFRTLQNNLSRVDFSRLLLAVMSIADEVDSQLAQQMTSYVAESKVDRLAVVA